MERSLEKTRMKYKTCWFLSLSTGLWFIRTVPYKVILIWESSIPFPNILKTKSLPPLLFYFLPSLYSCHLRTCHCSRVGEQGLSGCLSLSCSDCLSTAPRLCPIFGTQTWKWNGMLGSPGCLYNKECVASLGNNETRWIAIQVFVVLPALDKAKSWPNVERGHLFCSQYWNG